MSVFINENWAEILDEAYVGETQFIKDFIELIHEARAPYVGKMKKPIKGNKDFIKIGDMLAEEFGFYSVDFSVPFDTSMNAFTYPITMSTDKSVIGIKPKFTKNKGYKYDVSNRLCILVAVTAGVWFNPEFSDREVVAAILHEIGHSFVLQSERMIDIIEANRLGIAYNVIYQIMLDLLLFVKNPTTGLYTIPRDINTILNTSDKGKEIRNKVSKELSKNPLFAGVASISEWFSTAFMQFFKEAFSLFDGFAYIISIPMTALNKLLSSFNKPSIAFSKSQEYLSDSFAVSYGLGPEISSFLVKIEYSAAASGSKVDEILSKIPIVGALRETVKVPVLLLSHGINTHPSTPARINQILKDLNKELNSSDLSPKTKKAIQANIKSLEAIKEECTKVPEKKKYNGEMVRKMWIAYITKNPEELDDLEDYYTDLETRDKYVKESTEEDLENN